MTKSITTLFLLLNSLVLSAQEVSSQLIIPEKYYNKLMATSLERDGDRMYFYLPKVREDFANLNLDYDLSFITDDESVVGSNGLPIYIYNSILFEYEPDVGIVDHTYFNYTRLGTFDVEGDILAASITSPWTSGIDDNILYVEQDSILGNNPKQDLIVYDKMRDSILWYYDDQDLEHNHDFKWENIVIDGDYLYYATTYHEEQLFMGDTLTHTYDGFIQYSTMLHKINWRTGVKEWTRRTGAEDLADRVRTLKVVDDGTLYMDIRINGPFTWAGEQLDPDGTFGTGNLAGNSTYNTVIAKISPEGEYIDHVHIINHFDATVRDVTIENDGTVLCYGASFSGNETIIGQDTIRFELEDAQFLSGVGALFVFDNELNLNWHKTYEGLKNNFVYTSNNLGDDIVVSTLLRESIELDGVMYSNEYDNESETQQLVILYDEDGNIKGAPFQFGNRMSVWDIIEVSDEHYLFFIETFGPSALDDPIFLGTEIGTLDGSHNNIIEFKGDLFQILSSIQELSNYNDFELYPNPVKAGGVVNLGFSDFLSMPTTISVEIINIQGQLLIQKKVAKEGEQVQLEIPDLQSGMYVLRINSEEKLYRKTIFIN